MFQSDRHPVTGRYSRRTVLGLAAAAVTGTLVGCSSKSAGADFGGNTSLKLPASLDTAALPGAVTSSVPGVPPGFVKLPQPLPKASTGVPGKGGEFTTFQVNWISPPQPESRNRYWQELNKRLGVEYKPTLVPADAYDTKLATMLSGGKVPDLVFLHTESANAQQAIKDGAFAELSGVLGGDGIKKYPNLAQVPEFQWRASAVNNGIYGVPTDLAYVNSLHVYRRDWAARLGLSAAPKNADEFYQLMTGMSRSGAGKKYGFGGYGGGVKTFVNAMFRVPNNWRESGGKLTSALETDEFEAALQYTAKLWKGGAFHPDALSLGDQGAKDRSLFESGVTGWQVASADTWYFGGSMAAVKAKNAGADPVLLQPFGHDGGKYAFPRSPGFYALVAVSAEAAEDPERLDEILRIMDYLRSPLSSEEGIFLRYGVEGVHYRLDAASVQQPIDSPAAGDPVALSYTGLAPVAFYYPGDAKAVKDTVSYTEALTRQSIADPTVGLFAASSAKSAGKLDDLSTDYVNGIVSGRRPFSDLAKYRSDWRAQGGDTVRQELEKALEAAR